MYSAVIGGCRSPNDRNSTCRRDYSGANGIRSGAIRPLCVSPLKHSVTATRDGRACLQWRASIMSTDSCHFSSLCPSSSWPRSAWLERAAAISPLCAAAQATWSRRTAADDHIQDLRARLARPPARVFRSPSLVCHSCENCCSAHRIPHFPTFPCRVGVSGNGVAVVSLCC